MNRVIFWFLYLKVSKRRFLLIICFVHREVSKGRFLFFWLHLILRSSHFKRSECSSTLTERWFLRFHIRILWCSLYLISSKSWNTRTLNLNMIFLFNFLNSRSITLQGCINSFTCLYFLLVIISLHGSLNKMLHGLL